MSDIIDFSIYGNVKLTGIKIYNDGINSNINNIQFEFKLLFEDYINYKFKTQLSSQGSIITNYLNINPSITSLKWVM